MRRLALAVIGALGLGAGLLHLHDAPPPQAPERAAPVAPLPLAWPAAAVRAAAPAAATPPPAAPSSPPSTPSAPSAVGSEGYGPHIERAAAGSDPAAAWEAVQWLRACDAQGAQRDSAEALRNHGVAPDFMTQRMAELDAIARRCQTVTAAHRTLVPQLAAVAVRGGVPGAAALYVDTASPRDLPADQRSVALEALRRDARQGHAPSLWAAALAPADWGLSDEERLRYVLAAALQRNQPVDLATARDLARQAGLARQSGLTDAQLAAGLQSARDLLQRAGFPVPM